MPVRSNTAQLLLLIAALVGVSIWYWHAPGPGHHVEASLVLGPDKEDEQRVIHRVRDDGLLEANMSGRHPMWQLISEGERQWEEMKARQSKTLAEAVAEYIRRNGYSPPAGFDLWWQFVQKHNVKLVDEFDQINYDITPYLALSPETFRARVDTISDPTKGFHVNITKRQLARYGPMWWDGNPRGLSSMMMGFSRGLPDLAVHGSTQLRGDQWIGEDLRREADAKARAGQYFTEEELQHFERVERNPRTDLKNACHSDDPVFKVADTSDTPTFIASHITSISPCSNARIHRASPFLFERAAKPPRLTPYFVFSKHRPDSGFLLPSNTWEFYDPALEDPHTWEERAGRGSERLFWRGPVTGWNWYKGIAPRGSGVTWRDGARAKLSLSFGSASRDQPEEVLVLVEEGGGGLVTKTVNRAWLNEKWMDIGLTGAPVQCSQQDGTCDEMRQAPMWKEPDAAYRACRKKFVVDLDSNAWSEEFQRKLSRGIVVLKSTVFPEWNTKWLIPYYHYIPIQNDYSDVYNIMAFFLGDPETGIGGHEDMAAKISRHASRFAREYWRWADMQAYLFRLMLEYARLGSEDRAAASFSS